MPAKCGGKGPYLWLWRMCPVQVHHDWVGVSLSREMIVATRAGVRRVSNIDLPSIYHLRSALA